MHGYYFECTVKPSKWAVICNEKNKSYNLAHRDNKKKLYRCFFALTIKLNHVNLDPPKLELTVRKFLIFL
jgi:hypothetical protein